MTSAGDTTPPGRDLAFAMNLSLAIGGLMLLLKFGAYHLTGSSAVLSDAAESIVHLAAVGFAAYSLGISRLPPDRNHPYGHSKISFLSAGFEGGMIILASLYILYSAIAKWITGLELDNIGAGTLLTAAAALVNGALGMYLVRLGRRRNSLILVANGRHVLTDFWTSSGAILALVLVLWTGWLPWDPIFGIAMALNILVSGGRLIRESIAGLMDEADPALLREIEPLLTHETAARGLTFHELRHRNTGAGYEIDVHLQFPPETPIEDAHRTATEIEDLISAAVAPGAMVTTHLEPFGE